MDYKKIMLLLNVLFSTTSHIVGMDASEKMGIYQSECGIIAEKHETELTRYMEELNSNSVCEKIFDIENNFQNYYLQLKKKEQEACDLIRDAFNISEQEWKNCNKIIQKLKGFNHRRRNFPLLGIRRDPSFPEDIKMLLETTLLKNGIHPQRISFECGCSGPSRITLKYIKPCWEIRDKKLHIHKDKTVPGAIKINVDEMNKLSFEARQAICIDAVAAIAQDEGITVDTMAHFVSLTTKETKDVIEKSSQFTEAQFLFLHNARLYACLENKHAALSIKRHLCNFFNEKVTVDDFALVSKIEWQWRALAALRKYVALAEKNGIRSIDPIFSHVSIAYK